MVGVGQEPLLLGLSRGITLWKVVNTVHIKYEMHVVEIGPLVSEFVEAKILVFFKFGAPPELAEFAVLHKPSEFFEEVCPRDYIVIGNEQYQVTAVGEVANNNIRELGHLVMKCNGRTSAELPGDVCVEDKALIPIEVGMIVRVIAGSPARKQRRKQ
jgi:PTS system glucitol/sorbitol-specific IIA component